jgi:hypothetical protein
MTRRTYLHRIAADATAADDLAALAAVPYHQGDGAICGVLSGGQNPASDHRRDHPAKAYGGAESAENQAGLPAHARKGPA